MSEDLLLARRADDRAREKTPVARMNAALDLERAGSAGAAEAVIAALAVECPSWDEPHVRLAELARRGGRTERAAAAYERALDRNPTRPEALVGLGALLIQTGDARRARLLLSRACGCDPDRVEAWDALGLAALADGDLDAAEDAFARAQTLAPLDFGLALRRSEAALAAGRGEAELVRLEIATLIDPLDVVQLAARGVLLERLGHRDAAVDILEAAVALAPDATEPLLELCNVVINTDQMRRAEELLRRAVALAPDRSLLRNNLAVILGRRHRHEEARILLESLIAEEGKQPEFLCNLSNSLVALGLQSAAVATADAAIAAAPDLHLARRTLANALPYHAGADAAGLLQAQRAAAACLPALMPVAFENAPSPTRPLRIGLLSACLKAHPVGWLTLAGFENLDPAAFEIVCLGPEQVGDPLQRRFRAIAADWHDVGHATPEAIAASIRALGIDILIDLGGYGDRGMMTACAWRAAPVQVKWVGMQNHSTGLPAMDWFITDRWETPPELQRFYSERLLVMPDGYVCYSPPAYAPDIAPLPALHRGAVTFGCFNNLAKLTPRVFASWAEILTRIPDARLVIKTHQCDEPAVRARVRADFAAAGGEIGRLDLRGSSPHRVLLGEYGDIDIVLDPFPYTGGLTTCEALWMGVPTITLAGDTFAARHATSHLSNVGLSDWVATDLDGYMRLAERKAADVAALATLRAGLRDRVRASPLCDAPRFGREFDAALRRIWVDWCRTQSVEINPRLNPAG